MPYRSLILSIMLLTAHAATGQDVDYDATDPIVDSLLREYAAATADSVRLRLCCEIGLFCSDADTVKKYSEIGVALFDGKDSMRWAYCYNYLGWAHLRYGHYTDAIESYTKAMEIYKALSVTNGYTMSCANASICYRYIHNYKKMWTTIYDALSLATQNADTAYMCYCYHVFADFYDDLNIKQQGIDAANKGLSLAVQSNNYQEAGTCAAYISLLHAKDDDSTSSANSIYWAHRSIEYFDKADGLNSLYWSLKCNAFSNLAEIYLKFAEKDGSQAWIDSAEFYIDKCEEIYDITLFRTQRAKVEYVKHNYKKSAKMLHDILEYANENDDHFYDHIIFNDLQTVYAKLGDYKNALKYLDLYNKETELYSGTQAIMEAAAFEAASTVQQEEEYADHQRRMANLELTEKQSHFHRMLAVCGLGLVALLALLAVITRMLQTTRKSNAILVTQNSEIAAQNELIKTEKEKNAEINAKIRQSMTYARRIQLSTIYTDNELREVFPDAFVYYRPQDIVSGDWYWAAQIGRKKILAVGGSAKHGVQGALVCLLTVSALKDVIGQLSAASIISPTGILKTFSKKLPQSAHNRAAGLSLCVFGDKSLKFAGINQNAILVKNAAPIVMYGDKPGDLYHTVSKGDSVVVYSAATKRQLKVFTSAPENFAANLSQHAIDEQKQTIDNVLASEKQTEDITVVLVKI